MEISELYDLFFSPFDGPSHTASFDSRRGRDSLEFTYGQIYVPSWKQILEVVHAEKCTHFIDLGSGSGKAVLLTLYLYPHIKATGVEFLPRLHELACEIAKKAEKEMGPCLDRLALIQDDFFNVDLSGYDLLLVNSTCFDDPFLERMINLLKQAPEGALIISIGRALNAPFLESFFKGVWRMGWQSEGVKAPVFIYKKIK